MHAKDWGNTEPTRQNTETSPPVHKFNYVKLYLTIVLAIITAFFIMALFSFIFSFSIINALLSDLSPTRTPSSMPTQQHSSGLQSDLQKLSIKPTQRPSMPAVQSVQANQQTSAKKSDIQTCTFWRQQYDKEKSDRNKMHVNSSCERAYGNLWQRIN